MVAQACHSQLWEESVNRKIMVQAGLGRNSENLFEKILKANRAGGMVRVVAHLPSKHQALSSNTTFFFSLNLLLNHLLLDSF
jgi:hypothetical protein